MDIYEKLPSLKIRANFMGLILHVSEFVTICSQLKLYDHYCASDIFIY